MVPDNRKKTRSDSAMREVGVDVSKHGLGGVDGWKFMGMKMGKQGESSKEQGWETGKRLEHGPRQQEVL
jgi:hypothetical protein